jgi:catechol 2,3-dioxygenase-like lactoylglutathione lyase family enzyme
VFDHVTIRSSDLDASRSFYETGLGVLGLGGPRSGGGFREWNDFSIAQATADRPATQNLHVAFVAPSRAAVDSFWRELTNAGYRDDGAPGPREYRPDYYGAFVLDPDGNSAEAVHHGELRTDGGVIDHLWLRVRDVEATKRFYATIAPIVGIRRGHDSSGRVQYYDSVASTSWVAGDKPTANVHLAFRAPDRATVDEFHGVAVAAGYSDNGAPGERPEYHAGYYGAYVLDPDGNNIEAVFHDRG